MKPALPSRPPDFPHLSFAWRRIVGRWRGDGFRRFRWGCFLRRCLHPSFARSQEILAGVVFKHSDDSSADCHLRIHVSLPQAVRVTACWPMTVPEKINSTQYTPATGNVQSRTRKSRPTARAVLLFKLGKTEKAQSLGKAIGHASDGRGKIRSDIFDQVDDAVAQSCQNLRR